MPAAEGTTRSHRIPRPTQKLADGTNSEAPLLTAHQKALQTHKQGQESAISAPSASAPSGSAAQINGQVEDHPLPATESHPSKQTDVADTEKEYDDDGGQGYHSLAG